MVVLQLISSVSQTYPMYRDDLPTNRICLDVPRACITGLIIMRRYEYEYRVAMNDDDDDVGM